MNKGDIAWQIAHGETPDNVRNHPALKGLNIPRTGRQGRMGTLVTKTLLIAGEGGFFTTPSGQRGAMLRAYDKATGKEVGEVYMPAPQTGSPMTYMLDGRQVHRRRHQRRRLQRRAPRAQTAGANESIGGGDCGFIGGVRWRPEPSGPALGPYSNLPIGLAPPVNLFSHLNVPPPIHTRAKLIARMKRRNAVARPGVYPTLPDAPVGTPLNTCSSPPFLLTIPFTTSTTTHPHPIVTADGHPRRNVQCNHQTPNARTRMSMIRNPCWRYVATKPVRNRAGGNDSQSRPTYSSTECAA